MAESQGTQKSASSASKERKIGFVLLLFFGVITVALGALQLRNTIYSPFVVRVADRSATPVFVDENTRLQQIDTDRDGLNDYEELNFYTTSPYLEDTDSDGLLDKEEIDAGTDPLCPKGALCESVRTEEAAVSETATPQGEALLLPGVSAPTVADILSQDQSLEDVPTDPLAQDLAGILQNPAALRDLLTATGRVSQEQVDALSDDQLLGLVEELLAEQAQGQ